MAQIHHSSMMMHFSKSNKNLKSSWSLSGPPALGTPPSPPIYSASYLSAGGHGPVCPGPDSLTAFLAVFDAVWSDTCRAPFLDAAALFWWC